MPILANAKKALRVSKRKAIVNQRIKSRLKTMLDAMKANPSEENLTNVFSSIDKATNRNLFHRNKAARLKSQMAKLVADASATSTKASSTKKASASAK